jgi:surfeit locus 1 family protein
VTFRPYPGMTIAFAILFAILCGLGVWQLERLQWKLALIAQVNRQIHMRPVELDDGGTLIEEPETDYTHVTVRGQFNNSKETYLFGTGLSGEPVYHVLVPFIADGGHTYLVDRGVVPKEKLNPETRREGLVSRPIRLTGIWRWPSPPGYFTPHVDIAHRVWFWHDLAAIQSYDHIHLFQPGVIEADATPNPGGLPRGGQTVVSFRNEHLSYAITWFGLAAMLLGVWFSYHISRGRIALK